MSQSSAEGLAHAPRRRYRPGAPRAPPFRNFDAAPPRRSIPSPPSNFAPRPLAGLALTGWVGGDDLPRRGSGRRGGDARALVHRRSSGYRRARRTRSCRLAAGVARLEIAEARRGDWSARLLLAGLRVQWGSGAGEDVARGAGGEVFRRREVADRSPRLWRPPRPSRRFCGW